MRSYASTTVLAGDGATEVKAQLHDRTERGLGPCDDRDVGGVEDH